MTWAEKIICETFTRLTISLGEKMNSGQVKAYSQSVYPYLWTATNKPVHFLNKRMAELLFELVSKLINQLGSIVYNEISLACGVKSDLQKLEHIMFTIKDVVLDAEEKQAHNKKICNWVGQLKDVFLDAEDLLDEFDCKALRRKVMETSHGTSRKVRHFFSRSNPIAFQFRVGLEIQEIRERLNELKANKAFFYLCTDHHHHHQGDHTRENMTHSFVTASKIIGRESEKKAIADLLMQSGDDRNGSRNVSVIPIVQ